MNTYGKFARRLPIPTGEQTRQFAEYVTSAHSWYKHLRTQPPVPFIFYLDPNSGRSMVRVSDDEVAFVDNVDEKDAFHYTWQKTASYRRRFGHWNYHAPFGTSFQFQREEGVVDTAGTGLMILFEEAGWAEVPKRLALAGTALVSALMYAMHRPEHAKPFAFEVESPFMHPPRAVRSELVRQSAPSSTLPEGIAGVARKLEALWDSENYRLEKVETYRALNELHSKTSAECTATNRTWDEVLDPEVGRAVYERTQSAWEKTESRRKERALLASTVEAIERERQRQIAGMVSAMNQFIETLHNDC